MPKKDGRQALKDIKSDANLRNIPVVVFTTSNKREDIVQCYGIGANSFMVKPVTFDGLVEAMKTLGDYWFEIVTLAHEKRYRGRSGSSVSDWGK